MVETLPFFAKVCKVICVLLRSRPARGAWIEISNFLRMRSPSTSRPARGAWIEMLKVDGELVQITVAPRKGRVD